MDTIKVTMMWDAARDVLALYREPAGYAFTPDPLDDYPIASTLLELDESERETGRVAGFEIVGFRDFDRWDAIPDTGLLWQLPGREPLPLLDLLRRVQREIKQNEPTLIARSG